MRGLALLLLTGCSALLGIDDVVPANPDSPLQCTVDPSYAPAPAMDGDPGVSVEFDPRDGSYFFALKLNSTAESDIFAVWLRPGNGVFASNALAPGSYGIAGDDTEAGSCGLCVIIAANFDVKNGTASDFYLANAGDVNINSLSGRFKISLRNLTFRHLNLQTGAVQDACMTSISSASADLALSVAGQPDARPPDAGPPDAPPSDAGTITGTAINSYLNAADGTITPAPVDLRSVAVEAYTPNGTGFTKTTGSGTQAGAFSIPNVPGGPRVVRIDNQYFFTMASSGVDFGEIHVGRPDQQHVDDGAHVFHVDATGADPMPLDGDFFELYSPQNGGFTDECQASLTDPTNLHCDVSSFNRVVDKDKGDVVTLSELVTRTSVGGEAYRALTRAAQLPAFSTSATGPVTVPSVALQTIAQTGTTTIDWRLKGFHDAKTFINPNATFSVDNLYIFALAGGMKTSLFGSDAPDVFHSQRYDEVLDEVNFGAVTFGNPYPAGWSLWAFHYSIFTVDETAPGATSAVSMNSFLVRVAPLTALNPLTITLTPVLSPTINGRDANMDQTGVGETPLLAWNAPGITPPGGVTGYYLDVFELSKDTSNNSNEAFVATLFTPNRQIRVPPGVLQLGKTYFTYITAFATPSANFGQGPFKRGMPYTLADRLTAPFSP